MRALVVTDSFKGCLDSCGVERAVKSALLGAGFAGEDVVCLPASDGGEGFCRIATEAAGGTFVSVPCLDPLGRPVNASYGLSSDGSSAYIESASVIGLDLVEPSLRNPLLLSSFGLGQMIRDAVIRGVKDIYIGLGGTTTCDGGIGMMMALGVRFAGAGELREDSRIVLADIKHIDTSELFLRDSRLHCMADTRALYYGPEGAARMFGPQKGLPENRTDEVDAWMERMAGLICSCTGTNLGFVKGGGAAGGTGGALVAFCGAEMLSGAQGVLQIIGFDAEIRKATLLGKPFDLIVTGEGQLDIQTHTGKLPWEVLCRTRALDREIPSFRPKVICVTGRLCKWRFGGFDAIIPTTPPEGFGPDGRPLEIYLEPETAAANITDAVRKYISG